MPSTRVNIPIDSRKARVTSTRASRHSLRPAFSLVEVVCVVLVIGILSAIAMPRYGNAIARYRVETAAKRLAADLMLTRDQAAQQSKAFKVVFVSGASSSYSVAGLRDLDRRATAAYQVNLWEPPYRVSINRMAFAGVDRIAFDGFGMPSSAGAIQLSASTFTATVSIDGSTGEISIAGP
jgi:prepilin-type N-terminal cleavage/methylation domain-containing protein